MNDRKNIKYKIIFLLHCIERIFVNLILFIVTLSTWLHQYMFIEMYDTQYDSINVCIVNILFYGSIFFLIRMLIEWYNLTTGTIWRQYNDDEQH